MFYRMVNGHFLLGLVALLVVVGIVLLIVYLTSRKYKAPAAKANGTTIPADMATATVAAATNPTQAFELEDLARQLNALTAVWAFPA